ncbi:MAG: succinylglutamate desuccinylase/aspartoacylase family protein [Pirellulales bacterium]|nr:succinylglutamate desuccinylase/aspartoacylase family protein [Pirellulales bacterium]
MQRNNRSETTPVPFEAPIGVQLATTTICGTSPGPHLLVTGGVHGDEYEGPAAIRRLADELSPDRLRGRVTLVPVVNEPALALRDRCGPDGLDLARTCPGKSTGTVTEQIAAALSDLIRAAEYYIDLHSGGVRMRVSPLAGYMLHADEAVLDAQRRMAWAYNLPIVWGTDAALEGRSLSVARDAGVPAIYAEYQGAGQCDPAGVTAYFEGCLNVLAELGMIDRARPASRVEHVVEDCRAGSGHMQVCYPAPLAGVFEPAVKLGQRVQAGDALGTVADSFGQQRQTIYSEQSGLVIVLRCLARVDIGESLAVILELDEKG